MTGGVRARATTIGSLWDALIDAECLDDVLQWPPDLFALVDRVLEASEAYRFVVSPPDGVERKAIAGTAARGVATSWWQWLDGTGGEVPEPVGCCWAVLRAATDVGIDELSAGREWHVIEALLELHAIADEACAGLGAATAVAPGPGCTFRAMARELLAEVGSLSRLPVGVLRVLPRCRSNNTGISISSLSRHVCVRGPQVDVDWHRMLSRPTGVARPSAHANVVLLPWPLRVRARDFRPASTTLPAMDTAEYGFFEFRPEEPLDLDLVDDVMRAAVDEAGTVDVVVMPESAITPADIEPLEALLAEFGVWFLIAGVREPPATQGGLGANWVHAGVRQNVVWRHAAQHKHHRWCLDSRQINQYHLGGSLTESMRWWEAVAVPRRSLQILDEGAVTLAPLLCEDLARMEPVADLIRSIGPSLVITLLLDGPQLSSRWTARYASVLADDPGSAVLTLTSYGMVRRCRPPGCQPSRVVALWKDATGDLVEIELDDGAEAVLIATNVSFGGCVTADGRRHPGTASNITLVAARSLRAEQAPPRQGPRQHAAGDGERPRSGLPELQEQEVSKATSWAEAVSEAVMIGPAEVRRLLTAATDPAWRERLGLPRPTQLFLDSIAALRGALVSEPTIEALAAAARHLRASNDPAAAVTGTLLGIAFEERVVADVRAGRIAREVLDTLQIF